MTQVYNNSVYTRFTKACALPLPLSPPLPLPLSLFLSPSASPSPSLLSLSPSLPFLLLSLSITFPLSLSFSLALTPPPAHPDVLPLQDDGLEDEDMLPASKLPRTASDPSKASEAALSRAPSNDSHGSEVTTRDPFAPVAPRPSLGNNLAPLSSPPLPSTKPMPFLSCSGQGENL